MPVSPVGGAPPTFALPSWMASGIASWTSFRSRLPKPRGARTQRICEPLENGSERKSMTIVTGTMTDEQRKSVALEYLRAFDNGGGTYAGGGACGVFCDDAQA